MRATKRLEKALLTQIGKRLARHGFSTKPAGQSFYREVPFGRLALHVSFVEGDFLEATLDVAVRFDEVEELVTSSSTLLTASEKLSTNTLGCELGNLVGGRPRRWVISHQSDLSRIAEEMVGFFAEVGVPYLEKYSRIECTLEALGSTSQEAWLHDPIHVERAKRAIALAFCAGDRGRFERLIGEMESYLTARSEPGRASFKNFAADLASRWP